MRLRRLSFGSALRWMFGSIFLLAATTCGNERTPFALGDGVTAFPPEALTEALTPSLDTWVDACDAVDLGYARLLQAEVFLVPRALVNKNPDGTYAISTQAYKTIAGSPSSPLDPASKYYGQTQALSGRSGFLVSPSQVITAPHNSTLAPSVFAAIFGMSSRRSVSGECVQPDFGHVPASNVFWPVDAGAVNGYTAGADYLLFSLDRATARLPVRIRRTGQAEIGDPVTTLSHPERLSTKVDLAGQFTGIDSTNTLFNGVGAMFNGVHVADGSSGGMFFNLSKGYVEAAVAFGIGCFGYQQIPPWPAPTTSWIAVSHCPTTSVGPTNASIKYFAPNVPAFELLVNPLDKVVYRADLSGTLLPAQTLYTLNAPADAAASLQWKIQALAPERTADAVASLSFSPTVFSGTLSPGGKATVSVVPSTTATSCGTFVRKLLVEDATNGFHDVITHQFEIGLKEYSVTPASNFTAAVINAPYNAGTAYTVKNLRPSPVTAVLTATSWLSVSAAQGGVLVKSPAAGGNSILLGAAGSATDTAVLTVATNHDVRLLTPYESHATDLVFGYTSADAPCAVQPAQTRTFTMATATQAYQKIEWADVPMAMTAGTFAMPLVSKITIPDMFPITSVKLDVGFWDGQPYFYEALENYATGIKIVLVSPDGKSYTLWNDNAIPSPAYTHYENIDNDSENVLHIEDVITPAPTGARLADLNGKSGQGVWTLQILNSRPNTMGMLSHWRLTMQAAPLPAMLGVVDGVFPDGGSYTVGGWACVPGAVDSVNVQLYAGGPKESGTLIGTYSANSPNEVQVAAACWSTGAHYRYHLSLSPAVLAGYVGQEVYVYGVSNDSLNPATGVLFQSGKFTVPATSPAAYSPTSAAANDALSGWPATNAIDGLASTCYASQAFASSTNDRRGFLAAWIPYVTGGSPVTKVKMAARMGGGRALAFPPSYQVYVTDPPNAKWIDIGNFHDQPDASGNVAIHLDGVYRTHGVLIIPTELGKDDADHYFFEMCEIALAYE